MAFGLAIMTVPLRVAFMDAPVAMTSKEALRHYSALMVVAVGVSLGLPLVLAVLAPFFDESVFTIVLGVFLYLVLLVSIPRLVLARRGREPLAQALASVGKLALLCAGSVALVLAVLGLRALAGPPKAPVVGKVSPTLLDPLGLDGLHAERWTVSDNDGVTVWFQVDGGTLERTLAKLEVVALSSLVEVRKTPKATGLVVCRVPRRLRTPDAERESCSRKRSWPQPSTGLVCRRSKAGRSTFASSSLSRS